MASFDDLAFVGPPTTAATAMELFCRDCDEVPQAMTNDGKRCLVCGCELEPQQPTSAEQSSPGFVLNGSEMNVQELQTMVMRLLNHIGEDWNGGATGARRPASDEAGDNAVLLL
ncbi:hypothetical protein KXD40_000629 [Peronospora effusa]|uniref:Uncharacterized protein n=1 Tax=Peronospora effusa TaxID=542832 RepID=A0A3M6VNZ7_9STRA|nr:hypothetical protein DD238_000463 [Peronospora effusa]RQM17675.1 hypothetical protein DD237_000696 [Peronospora effusa]UIZ20708.1 hypothetical protein KXD40_000629 [Peronospora effusa]